MERLGEVEHHFGRESLQLLHDANHVIEDRHGFHLVPQPLQARQHIGFSRLVLFFLQLSRRKVSPGAARR